MIRIIIAEDNQIVREGIAGLLNGQEGMEVIGEAENGLQVLEMLEKGLDTDIILSDLNMPELDGIRLTERVSSQYPHIKVVILTMHLRDDFITRTLEAGAQGYVLKNGNFEALFEGIRKVYAGDQFVAVET